ncbi:hypothetical protein Vadar_032216 [Vaccinium darrowii]|uniref:Uncharacterized protein n=1 Tax=Vaccinium darrowii TaxID=229202 RepID=A0ACB7XUV3_9ERIC|nr:hypothetical protein Vadar_032216 [Vaccinium darrowii]
MAKAIPLIAFAISILALASNVQGHVKKDKLNVHPKNNSSLWVHGSVSCVTCKNNGYDNIWKPLRKAKVELACENEDNGTVTFTSHGSVNDKGNYSLYMDPNHRGDMCKVHVVSSSESSDPLCNVKAYDFDGAAWVRFEDGATEAFISAPIGFVNKESVHNCYKIAGPGGKLIPTVTNDNDFMGGPEESFY